MTSRIRQGAIVLAAVFLFMCLAATAASGETKAPAKAKTPAKGQASPETKAPADKDMEPLRLFLPHADFSDGGSLSKCPRVERCTGPRPPFMVPKGTENLSMGKAVLLSDPDPGIGEAPLVTDGNKECYEGAYVEMGPGPQWAQVDLGSRAILRAIIVWHRFQGVSVYHDVIVQVSDDPKFKEGVTILYNNDHDNSSGLGVGEEYEYIESDEGRLIDAKGVRARYVRCYTNGSNRNELNQLTEIEVWGQPAK